ncbi:MAG: hypothetical protein ACQETE_03815 [Bacteroidota bacterium]
MNRVSWVPALVGIILLISSPVWAQQNEQSGQNSLLPEIDPQDIEIRGEFTARFPGLRRQPILGFNPTPRVYQIDPNRMPFMESGDQIIANLPVSELARPAAPDSNWYELPKRHKAWAYGGYGMLGTAELRGLFNSRNQSDAWIGDVAYTQTEGHLSDDQSAYRLAGVTLGKEWIKPKGKRLALLVDGLYDQHDLFNYSASSSNSTSDWVSGEVSLRGSQLTSAVDESNWYTDIRWTQHQQNDLNATFTEQSVQANVGYQRNAAAKSMNTVWGWGVRGSGIHHLTDDDQSETNYYGLLSLNYKRLVDYNLQFDSQITAGYGSDQVTGGHIIVLPELNVTYWFSDQSRLRAFVNSEIEQAGIFEQRQDNRFLGMHSRAAQEIVYRGGGTYNWDITTTFSVEAGAAYSRWLNKRYYVVGMPGGSGFAGGSTLSTDYYRAAYEDAQSLQFWSSATFKLTKLWTWATVKAYYNDHKLNSGGPIPYLEDWGVDITTTIRPHPKFRLELWSNLQGERLDAVTGNKMDGFLLAGARAEYYVSDQVGFYIKGQNLMDQQYNRWYGYPERSLTILGGVTVRLP